MRKECTCTATAVYGAPTFSLLLASHGGISSSTLQVVGGCAQREERGVCVCVWCMCMHWCVCACVHACV